MRTMFPLLMNALYEQFCLHECKKGMLKLRPNWPDLLHQFRALHFHPPLEVCLGPNRWFWVLGWSLAYLLLQIRRGKEKVAMKASSCFSRILFHNWLCPCFSNSNTWVWKIKFKIFLWKKSLKMKCRTMMEVIARSNQWERCFHFWRGPKDLPFMQIRKEYKEMRPNLPDLLH